METEVSQGLKLSHSTVEGIIDDLVVLGRVIKLKEKEIWRKGQSQHFVANLKSEFDQIFDMISQVKTDFKSVDKNFNHIKNKSDLETIELYSYQWTPNVKSLKFMLDIMELRTCDTALTDKEARILYDLIAKTKRELHNKDFEAGRYVNNLKQYLESKNNRSVINNRLQ